MRCIAARAVAATSVRSQTEEGEALRDDENFAYVGAWEWNGPDEAQTLHKEDLEFEYVKLTQRSYSESEDSAR